MEQREQFLHLERLLQVVIGAELGGFDGRLDGAVRRHQDDRQSRLCLVELAHEVKSPESGQAQISQHGVKGGFTGAAQTVIASRGVRDLEVSVLQHLRGGCRRVACRLR